jgi:hypothetical protein
MQPSPMRSSFEAGHPPMRTTWFYSSRRRRKDLTVRIKANVHERHGRPDVLEHDRTGHRPPLPARGSRRGAREGHAKGKVVITI